MAGLRDDFEFVLNGQSLRVSGIEPQTTLLDFVRSRGFTGAKEGCAEGECGACAVLLLARTGYQAVNSCLLPLPAVAGREVYTVEALAVNGELCEVQRAMAERGGSQCGYCTPGFVVSMFAAQYAGPARDPHSLGGNLCRCTGYRPIRAAFASLGAPPEGPFFDRLSRPVAPAGPLRYATPRGRFSRPATLDECFELLDGDPAARLVAGNTDLGAVTNLRDRRFEHLVSVEELAELREFRDGHDAVEIGAALTLTEIEQRWLGAPPIVREWLPLFASPLIRNRATLGGNLATASPIGDAAPMLLALDAEVRIASRAGLRTVPLHEFFRSYRQTALGPGELLHSVRIPRPFPAYARFFKVAKRSLDDISTVAAGIAFDGKNLRIAFGGVAPIPLRAFEAERAPDIEGAKDRLRRTLQPLGDHRGSAAYRLAIAQSLLEKFWHEYRTAQVAA